ncbi:MAG: TRAP transporter small permease [Clostridiales Family XIII bacterium]|jgi:TRAP-type C4-dicarboxylate transport system permease small subunit|nr:TRAP transporter small permease [Clostridiales Family XIII bacterium]
MRVLSGSIKYFLHFTFGIGAAALLCSMMFVVCNIAMRAFGYSIPGSVEVITNVNAVIAWMGFGHCALRDGHIKVDIFKKGPFFDRIWAVVTFVGLSVFGSQSIVQGNIAFRLATTTPILHFVKWPFYYVTAAGYFCMVLALLYLEAQFYYSWFQGRRGTVPGGRKDGWR